MCGIIGGVGQRDMVPILLEGLSRLEYRGYDSAGLAILSPGGGLTRKRCQGKVAALRDAVSTAGISGTTGIAHTRWATHGAPSEENAHPHLACDRVAVVHNGILENHLELRSELEEAGYQLGSQTDTEVLPFLIYHELREGQGLLAALQRVASRIRGAYALAVIDAEQPGRIVAARQGSPLLLGVGVGEHFLASDVAALVPVTQEIVTLSDGEFAELTQDRFEIQDRYGRQVERPIRRSSIRVEQIERGSYRHFMQKEIFEQPQAIAATLRGRIERQDWGLDDLTPGLEGLWREVESILILACGTSYHAGLVARYWLEAYAGLPCTVEVASEFRYRQPVLPPYVGIVAISQSGETADTLAAVQEIQQQANHPVTAICNVPESSLALAADATLYTKAGPEIGVASTKAFTTQLTLLAMLCTALTQRRSAPGINRLQEWYQELQTLPDRIGDALELDTVMHQLAGSLLECRHALFLGRGPYYPIALEGALKLKETSYIHAEGYPAGELKHGPLALVDSEMPVFVLAPVSSLMDKVMANLEEVRTRGGRVVVLTEAGNKGLPEEGITSVFLSNPGDLTAPLVYTVPLQLLAYHTAVLKGTDVDQPRNLAKSVTVE